MSDTEFCSFLNPIQDELAWGCEGVRWVGVRVRGRETGSPVTSTNVKFIPPKKISRPYLVPGASPKLLNLNQEHLMIFWPNSYKIETGITSLIELLELPNFGHMTASAL